jgi:hypothetical protein
MFSRIRFSFIAFATLLALLALPQITQASPQHKPSNQGISYAHFSFAALVGSNTPLIGGLALKINEAKGTLNGTLNLPGNKYMPVAGTISGGDMTIFIFLNRHHNTFMKAEGVFNGTNEYSGSCWEYMGASQMASGSWSALQVDQPNMMTAYAYHVTITDGPYTGSQMYAGLVLNNKTYTGTANLPDGSVTPVTFVRNGSHITMTFHLPYGILIAGQGTISGNSMYGTTTSSQGNGIWSAHEFDL